MHRSYGFQHLRHKRPRLLSPVKVGTHSAFGEKSHTRAHTAKQGPSFPRPQRGFALPVKSILFRHAFFRHAFFRHAFIYTFPGSLWTTTISNSSISDHLSSRFSASRTNGPRSLSRVKAGTHSAFGKKSHTRAYTPKQGHFRWGRYYYPRSVPHVSETLRGRGLKRQTLPLLGLGRGCSQRTQKAFGTAMRLCASLSRGVAAPLGCVICLQLGDVAVFSLCAQYFLNVRGGGGITTLGVFHTFRKPCVAGV